MSSEISSPSPIAVSTPIDVDPEGVTCRPGDVNNHEDFHFCNEGKFAVFADEQLDRAMFNEERESALTREAMSAGTVLLAEKNGERIGLIWFIVSDKCPYGLDYGLHFNKFAWVSFVWVKPDQRRFGIGRYLYRKLEEYCKSNGIPEVMLDVFLNNPRSQSFHNALGFKPFLQLYSKKIE